MIFLRKKLNHSFIYIDSLDPYAAFTTMSQSVNQKNVYLPPHKRNKIADCDMKPETKEKSLNVMYANYLRCTCARKLCICCRIDGKVYESRQRFVSAFVFAKSIKTLKKICNMYNEHAKTYGEYCHQARIGNTIAFRLAYLTKEQIFGDMDYSDIKETKECCEQIFRNMLDAITAQHPDLLQQVKFKETFRVDQDPAFIPHWVFFGQIFAYNDKDLRKTEKYSYACKVDQYPNLRCMKWLYEVLTQVAGMVIQISAPNGLWQVYQKTKQFFRTSGIQIGPAANGLHDNNEMFPNIAKRKLLEETGISAEFTGTGIKVDHINVTFAVLQ